MIRRLLSRLQSWLHELDAEQTFAPTQSSVSREFTIIIGAMVASLASSILATWIAQEVFRYSFPALLVLSLVITLSFATVLQIRGLPIRLRPLQIIAILLTFIAVQSTIIAYMYISNRPPIAYLVFDATESTSDNFPELLEKTIFAAQVQNTHAFGGLRIYGGRLSGREDCSDTVQLVAPVPTQEFETKLFDAFGQFDPRGNASLTIAVLKALEEDLTRYKGPIKLVVIAAGVDPRCDTPEIFEELATDIRSRSTREITIAIIGVGELTAEEEITLDKYARAFGGIYCSSTEIADLSGLILAPTSYFGGPSETANPCSQR